MNEIKLGIYKHFKGALCKIIGVAKYSEDYNQEFVVYSHPDKDGNDQLWVRPKEMFLEDVEINGEKKKRFEYVGE